MDKKFFLLNDKNNHKIINPKAQEIYFFLKKKCINLYKNIPEIKDFIYKNNNENTYLYYYPRVKRNNFFFEFINLINSIKLKINIYVFTFDFWIGSNLNYCHNIWAKKVFKAKTYKVICFSNNLEQLNFYHNFDYTKFKENIIFNNIWCCYDKSFCNFNNNPYKKLLLSGCVINNIYPERFILNNLIGKTNYINKYNYNLNDVKNNTNNYNLILNKYFACFTSNVYVQKNDEFKKFYNTHILLLKTFEILGSGSLLVMPKKEENYLKKYGLIHNENCYLIDFNKNIIEQIHFIFDNINKYNIVREKGQKLAKEKLNSVLKINEIKKLLKIK